MGVERIKRGFPAVLVFLALLVPAGTAHAAFPGENGRIAFVSPASGVNADIFTVDPSGAALLQATANGSSSQPAFSPDGMRIAFLSGGNLHTMDPYGNEPPQLVLDAPKAVTGVAWSPDGTRMVASILNDCHDVGGFPPAEACYEDLHVFNADGTDLAPLTSTEFVSEQTPAWSPDGTRIAFRREIDLWAIDPDGTEEANLTPASDAPARNPDWSPDGSRIAFDTHEGVWTMNSDGSSAPALLVAEGSHPAYSPDGARIAFFWQGLRSVEADGGGLIAEITTAGGVQASWQPLLDMDPPAGSGYPRPKSAGPLRVSLVVAYDPCDSGEATMEHGPPLAFPSCSPRRDGFLTVGTPDANGQPPEAAGFVRFNPLLGDPDTSADEADVRIEVHQTDVRRNTTGLPDYGGVLTGKATIRATDRSSFGGPDSSATTMEFPIDFTIPCAVTAGPAGSTCSLNTTANALAAGIVREGRRAIWELSGIRLLFPANLNVEYDDQLFLTQGVFVP